MDNPRSGTIYYKRARFLTHLPVDRLYTKSHSWLQAGGAGLWRVGMTKFASRMLGDMVEFGFGIQTGDPVTVGQSIGWMEGFKAVSDIYCVGSGRFLRSNPELERDITLIDSKPFAEGWLYEIQGEADSEAVDVHGYVLLLDATIDKMLAGRHEEGEHA